MEKNKKSSKKNQKSNKRKLSKADYKKNNNNKNKNSSNKKNIFDDILLNKKTNRKNIDSDKKNEENNIESRENEEEEEEDNNTISNICEELEGKEEKLLHKKKENIPKPKYELAKNVLAQTLNEEINTEVITMLKLKETFRSPCLNNYIDIQELNDDYFFILFDDIFYCININTFKILKNNESLQKYIGNENKIFNYFGRITDNLIGIISSDLLLIVKYDNNEVTLFQEISIKASIFKSFPSENLILINEAINKKDKKYNMLHYYTYNEKNSKYELQKKEEIDFTKFGEKLSKICQYFNRIGNIKKLKNGAIVFFTISIAAFNEQRNIDKLCRSFYESDGHIFLSIYFYENKELSLIYQKEYSERFIYGQNISESNLDETLEIWNDKNIIINEEDTKICFFIPSLYKYMKINYETKENKCQKFQPGEMTMNYFYDDKSESYFNILSDGCEAQLIAVLDSKKNEKRLFLPFYFSKIIPVKKGYILGVIQNTLTEYSYHPFFEDYTPNRSVHTNVCLLKYSI